MYTLKDNNLSTISDFYKAVAKSPNIIKVNKLETEFVAAEKCLLLLYSSW